MATKTTDKQPNDSDPSGIGTKLLGALARNKLDKLNDAEIAEYYNLMCSEFHLNPMSQPFVFFDKGGQVIMSPTKNCAEQLRSHFGMSDSILSDETVDAEHIVRARVSYEGAKGPRSAESTGRTFVGDARGQNRSNLKMAAETKAKNRATFSICGIGGVSEDEMATVEGAKNLGARPNFDANPPEPLPPHVEQTFSRVATPAQLNLLRRKMESVDHDAWESTVLPQILDILQIKTLEEIPKNKVDNALSGIEAIRKHNNGTSKDQWKKQSKNIGKEFPGADRG